MTLTGEPGIGKTRIAIDLGMSELINHADGVWFVSFDALSDASQVPQAVGAPFSLGEEPGRTVEETLSRYLRDKNLLLILDGCDEVSNRVISLCRLFLARCPRVRLLVTSREPLSAAEGRDYFVGSLSLSPIPHEAQAPMPSYALFRFESSRLFMDRARRRRPDFDLPIESSSSLCRLCMRLGGNPLAIELTAAQAHNLTIEQIEESIGGDVEPQHADEPQTAAGPATIHRVLEWSFGLLSVRERLLLRRLSVFAGGWEIDEAEQICSDLGETSFDSGEPRIEPFEVASILQALLRRSLVRCDETTHSSRFSFHPHVRSFVVGERCRSREDRRIRARHSAYYFRLATESATARTPSRRATALERLKRGEDNLRAALSEAIHLAATEEQASPAAGRRALMFAAAATPHWIERKSFSEGLSCLATILGLPAAEPDSTARAAALIAQSKLAHCLGRQVEAAKLVHAALAVYRSVNHMKGVADCLHQLGEIARASGDHKTATARYCEAAGQYRAIDDPIASANALEGAGGAARLNRDQALATQLVAEATSIRRQISYERAFAESLEMIGRSALDREDLTSAREYLTKSVDLWRKIHDGRHTAGALERLAILACLENNPSWAAALYLTACRLRAMDDGLLSAGEYAERRQAEACVRANVAPALLERAEIEDADSAIESILARADGPNVPSHKEE